MLEMRTDAFEIWQWFLQSLRVVRFDGDTEIRNPAMTFQNQETHVHGNYLFIKGFSISG